MNILHISPYFPDLDENHAGGICMGKEVESLKQWHEVFVLTFIASKFDRRIAYKYSKDFSYRSVSINKWTRLFHVVTQPHLPNFFSARSSLRFVLKLIYMIKKNHIDAIHAEYAAMGQYFGIIRWLFPNIRINLVEHDITIQSYERKMQSTRGIKALYYNWQCNIIRKFEGKYCRNADLVITFNNKDKKLLQEYYNVKNIRVLNPYYGLDEINGSIVLPKSPSICFLGQMGRHENYEAAIRLIHISKKIKTKIPDLQVYIVGNNPPNELLTMQSDYIHVTGFVQDIDQYLSKCQLAVFPLTLGAGIKIKVLRSLALGIPVITSRVGAEGIDEMGEVIVLAETDEDFTNKIECLLRDYNQVQDLSKKSQMYISKNFGWEKSNDILKDIYKG